MVNEAVKASARDRKRLVREAIRKLTDPNTAEDGRGSETHAQPSEAGHNAMSADVTHHIGQDV